MAYPMAVPYGDAIRSGYGLRYLLDATRGGVPVAGATGLQPERGSWEDDSSRDYRRSLTAELAPEPGLFGLLAPTGTMLKLTAEVAYLNGATVRIPCGVYDIDTENSGEIDGAIRISAPDKWVRIRRARFLTPAKSTPSMEVRQQIAALIRGALGATEPVTITATSTAKVGAQVWERDRDKTILELAKSIGAWVFFDRNGVATIADVPTIGASANWLINSGDGGVLTSVDRERSRERAYNIVKVSSSASDGRALFAPQFVWDNDPASPTYAGPGTGSGPTPPAVPSEGLPFGQVPYFYESPLLRTAAQAVQAGRSILHRVTGLASQVSLGAAHNVAMDALDVLDVAPPRERYDLPRPVERHMADKITYPLDPEQEQRIQGRSTRTDEYT